MHPENASTQDFEQYELHESIRKRGSESKASNFLKVFYTKTGCLDGGKYSHACIIYWKEVVVLWT